jgi:hypothetical protein
MSSIYQLTVEAQEIASLLSEGELTEEVNEILVINQDLLQKKAIDYGFVIKSFESDVSIIDEEIKRLNAIKSIRNNGIDRMKSALLHAMQVYQIEKIQSATINLSIRNNPESVDLINEYLIPKEFIKEKVTESIDKVRIKKALQNGEEVPGALLTRTKSIQIK